MLQKIVSTHKKNFQKNVKQKSIIGINIDYLLKNTSINGYMKSFRPL